MTELSRRVFKHPRWALHGAVVMAGSAMAVGGVRLWASPLEPAIIPTVHPTLAPTSAIQVPLRFAADQTAVWRYDFEQRMLLTGRVNITVGYRTLKADSAAVWLTPSREAGENTFDVAIYLSGNVLVREGDRLSSTRTGGTELLVTTRVTQSVLLSGTPESRSEEESPLVKRGNEIRQELLTRPTAAMHVPRIVITPAEEALQAGWIARGPNNRIIAGPGDIQVVRDAQGRVIPGATPPGAPKPAKPRPTIFATGDDVRGRQVGKELITIVPGAYLMYDSEDGKPPIEFRAQRMVVFSPMPEGGAATQPAGKKDDISTFVTGVYLEGDITIDQGDKLTVRAERVYYDFTSQRAIMLDATLTTVDETRNVPLYLRASEIRQLARGEFAARKVTFSTSEFHTPHYHIGASEIYLRDITPVLEGSGAGQGFDLASRTGGSGGSGNSIIGPNTYEFKAKDTTIDVGGVPIFYWPFLAGDTSKNDIPLRSIRVSNSGTYGLSLLTDWDLFGLAGTKPPAGLDATLNLDYFGKRGPGAGVQSTWKTDEDRGLLRTYAILDQGEDRLGKDRKDLIPENEARGRATVRNQHDLGDGLTLQLEASYISDPTFLEQYFQREFDTDKEHETSIYLKKQNDTDALTFLGKYNLMDFTSTADQVDDQFTTNKYPEAKYWRIGDNLFDMFTYYSESGVANVQHRFTDFTPQELGLNSAFLGVPAGVVPLNQKYKDYYRSAGWTDDAVVRGDTRHELDMPLQLGDLKVTPYVSGRATWWDSDFNDASASGSTTRLWGGGGVRTSMQFWKTYDDVQSTFFDVHRLRHVIEPQFNVFAAGSNQDRNSLQPYDRDVEGISSATGHQLSLLQRWQTKRGGPGHERNVDWITLNVSWNQFYSEDKVDPATQFYAMQPLRGFYYYSRPELSLVRDSVDINGVWRAGERVRFLGEANLNLDTSNLEQYALGVAVDQSPVLSYFFGNRYVRALDTNEWTFAVDYQLTKKYQIIAAESYDFEIGNNILSSVTLVRRMPRFNTAVTVTYDANNSDTTFSFTAWPEGFQNTGFGGARNVGGAADRQP